MNASLTLQVTGRSRPLVLVIEDEPAIRELCLSCVEESGAVVVGAADGQQGLEEARALLPDLIVTGVSMPVLDGFRLVKALDLDDRTQNIPVIFLSEEADHDHVAAGLELGAIAFITKPFDPELFTSIVTEALARFAA
jgi:two-component system, OmpR family, phosphate regulon response regulator PhoB